jgi:GNAT superfamily N-acetyltransferase
MSDQVVEFRDLGAAHVEELLALSNSLDWDYTRRYWQLLLSTGSVMGAFDEEQRLVATGAYVTFGPSHCFVGAVIVAKALQGRGIGKELMARLHKSISVKALPVQLIATPEGTPLYTKLGYEAVDTCHKLMRDKSSPSSPLGELDGVECKSITHDIMPEIIAFDRQKFGADRSHLLNALQQSGYAGLYLKNTKTNAIEGFAFQIEREGYSCIGPVVALNEKHAIGLCQVLCYGQSKPMRIDTYSVQSGFRERLEQLGFKEVDHAPVMVLGGKTVYSEHENVYALVSQAFG